GKTGNIVGLALLAAELGVAIPRVGTTTFRPPYTPVTLGVLAGHEAGANVEPTRHSAMHDWHVEHGARMLNAGLWKRPHSYPRPGESEDEAANREAKNVRASVGIVDVSTLGKIELQGRDVVELLNRMYINRWDTLAVGRCRYGVMLRDDGIIMDDGTTSRLGPTHFLMTTTTGEAVKVMQQIELLHRQAAARPSGIDSAGSLAARRIDRARWRRDAAGGKDRCRSRSCASQSDAGTRHVLVLEPASRRMDRAGDRRQRTRAAWRN